MSKWKRIDRDESVAVVGNCNLQVFRKTASQFHWYVHGVVGPHTTVSGAAKTLRTAKAVATRTAQKACRRR